MVQVVRSSSRSQTRDLAAKYASQGRQVTVVDRQGRYQGSIDRYGYGHGRYEGRAFATAERGASSGHTKLGGYSGTVGNPGVSAPYYDNRGIRFGPTLSVPRALGQGPSIRYDLGFSQLNFGNVAYDPEGGGLVDRDLWSNVLRVQTQTGDRINWYAAQSEWDEVSVGLFQEAVGAWKQGDYARSARFGLGSVAAGSMDTLFSAVVAGGTAAIGIRAGASRVRSATRPATPPGRGAGRGMGGGLPMFMRHQSRNPWLFLERGNVLE